MAATQATLDPESTPKAAEDAMVASASEPRTPPTNDRIISISRRAMPPRAMMSPA